MKTELRPPACRLPRLAKAGRSPSTIAFECAILCWMLAALFGPLRAAPPVEVPLIPIEVRPVPIPRDLDARAELSLDLDATLRQAQPIDAFARRELGMEWMKQHEVELGGIESRLGAAAAAAATIVAERRIEPLPIPDTATPEVRAYLHERNALEREFQEVRRLGAAQGSLMRRDLALEWHSANAERIELQQQRGAAIREREERAAGDIVIEIVIPRNASPEERVFLLEEEAIMKETARIAEQFDFSPEQFRDAMREWDALNAARLEARFERVELLKKNQTSPNP